MLVPLRYVALSMLMLSGACARGPSSNDFAAEVRSQAGKGAIDCGVVRNDSARKAAAECAAAALTRRSPFLVIVQVQGIDSEIFHGLAVNAEGSAVKILWDSDATGGSRFPQVRQMSSEPCVAPHVEASGRRITCGVAQNRG